MLAITRPVRDSRAKHRLLWPAVGAQYPSRDCFQKLAVEMAHTRSPARPIPCLVTASPALLPGKKSARAADKRRCSGYCRVARFALSTRLYYPFAFQLDTTFLRSAGGHRDHADYTVKSDSSNVEPMVFSIGNHIAFQNSISWQGTDSGQHDLSKRPIQFNCCGTQQGVLSGEQQPRSFPSSPASGRFRCSRSHTACRISQPAFRAADGSSGHDSSHHPTGQFEFARAAHTVQHLRRPGSRVISARSHGSAYRIR